MPGIGGSVRFDSAGDVGDHGDAIARRLGRGEAAHQIASSSTADASFGHATLSRGPGATPDVARDPASGVLVAVDGEFFGPFLAADADGASRRRLSAAAFALERYLEYGIDFVRHQTGFFAMAVWDPRDRTLHLANDRSGLRPLYYRVDGTRILFASEVRAIVGGSFGTPDSDRRGISDFVVFGFPLLSRTLFQTVKALGPATIATFRDDSMDLRHYWRLHYDWDRNGSQRWQDSLESVEERFLETFDQMTAADGPWAIPLSGGLDSRLIAAALHRRGADIHTYTIGDPASDDARIGAETALRLGVPNRCWSLEPADVLPWLPSAIHLTDGMLSALDTHILVIARNLPDEIAFAVDGTSSFDGMYSAVDVALRRYRPERYGVMKQVDWVFTHPLFDASRALRMTELFSPDFLSVLRESLPASLDELLASIPEDMNDPFDRADFLEQTQRVRRYNMMGTVVLRNFVDVKHAFFHPNLIDRLRRLPPRLRCKEKPLVSRMIARTAPVLADLPYERTGIRPDASGAAILRAYGKKFARKTMRKLGIRGRRRGLAVDYQQWLETDPATQEFFRSALLDERTLSRGLFDPDAMRRLVQEQIDGERASLQFLSRLVSLEYWHRFFVDGDPAPPWPAP